MITLYNAVSKDGYINEVNGSEDFVPYEVWHEFLELCTAYDVFAMGKNSYQAIQEYEPEERRLFESLPIKKVVISRDGNFTPQKGYEIIRSVSELPKLGKNILLSSGPSLNDVFLKEKLIDKIILNVIPVKVVSGLKQFSSKEPNMILKSEKNTQEGRVLCSYDVVY